MQLTNFQRVCRLGADLLQHPSNVPRYVANNVVARKSPLELALPWFSYGAIDFLERNLRRDMHVFEFGSGGSTIFFAERCASVCAVEEEAPWAARVQAHATERDLPNVEIISAPFDFSRSENFIASDYLAQVRSGFWDVIVVDGADNDFTIRPICFRAAESQVKPGGMIVVDDSWRYTQLRTTNRARSVEVFESVGPARFGVTSTDIYFY
jgi:precorrin-6B methylase 2